MKLEKLLLINFKNYKQSSFQFNPKLNLIYGENGNGKTNILEAISMICYTKSFLQSSESDCVMYGEDEFKIKGEFVNSYGSNNKVLFTYNVSDNKKKITLNDDTIGRLTHFFGQIPLVVLSPGDIKLTSGTPGDKRRNFDILISQISRIYFDDLKRYNRILKQKNSLLKDNLIYRKYSRNELLEMMDLWDKDMIETGTKIIMKRLSFVEEFQGYIRSYFKDIAGANYIPILEYESEMLMGLSRNEIAHVLLESNFRKCLEDKRNIEINRGMSLSGPQRDNYIFKMDKDGSVFDLKNFASQGEHKIFITALKLSEYIYLRDKITLGTAGEPILILDDLFSELDKKRTRTISSLLPNFNQVFITTTDIAYLKILEDSFGRDKISVFNIVNGTSKIIN
jgi:DNA replication and repair protein RecF